MKIDSVEHTGESDVDRKHEVSFELGEKLMDEVASAHRLLGAIETDAFFAVKKKFGDRAFAGRITRTTYAFKGGKFVVRFHTVSQG